MKKTILLLALVLVACLPAPKFPTDTRSAARAALLAMAYGGKAAYHMCAIHVAELAEQDKMVQAQSFADKCENILVPAGDGIQTAAAALDAWTAVDSGTAAQQKIGCAAAGFIQMATDIEKLAKDEGVKVPVEMTDGVEIAKAVVSLALPSCDPKNPGK